MSSEKTEVNFEAIARNHYNEIFHYLRKQTNSTEDAKDLTQEVFMKVWRKLNTYNPDKASIRTWVYRIAHNHVINHFRKIKNQLEVDLTDNYLELFSDSEDVVETIIQSENVDNILFVMRKLLSNKHYSLMNLYFFSDLTIPEIAKFKNLPLKSVYNTINVSIKKIRKEMEVKSNG